MWREIGRALLCLAVGTAVAAGPGEPPADGPRPPAKKRMRMNDPMSTGMMKPGMKKGEVKRAAERKAKAMQPAMEQEERQMPPAKP